MTVTEHNEQLVLEKLQLQESYRTQLATAARVIAVLMGETQDQKITAEQWAEAENTVVGLEPDDDGGVVVTVKDKDPSTG